MAYEVQVRPAAARTLRKLPPENRKAMLGVLANLGVEPRPPGCIKLKGNRPYLRLRIGDYRLIYGVDDAKRTLTVVIVGHRRDIYELLMRL